MTLPTFTPDYLRHKLMTRAEIALFDLRDEHSFAQAYPLFAAQL